MGVGFGLGLGVGAGDLVGVGFGLGLGVGVGDLVGVGFGVGLGVGRDVRLGVGVGVGRSETAACVTVRLSICAVTRCVVLGVVENRSVVPPATWSVASAFWAVTCHVVGSVFDPSHALARSVVGSDPLATTRSRTTVPAARKIRAGTTAVKGIAFASTTFNTCQVVAPLAPIWNTARYSAGPILRGDMITFRDPSLGSVVSLTDTLTFASRVLSPLSVDVRVVPGSIKTFPVPFAVNRDVCGASLYAFPLWVLPQPTATDRPKASVQSTSGVAPGPAVAVRAAPSGTKLERALPEAGTPNRLPMTAAMAKLTTTRLLVAVDRIPGPHSSQLPGYCREDNRVPVKYWSTTPISGTCGQPRPRTVRPNARTRRSNA